MIGFIIAVYIHRRVFGLLGTDGSVIVRYSLFRYPTVSHPRTSRDLFAVSFDKTFTKGDIINLKTYLI